MLKYYFAFFIGGRGSGHDLCSKHILGITVSAALEKLQLKIEGGGGQRSCFQLIKNSGFTGNFDVIP